MNTTPSIDRIPGNALAPIEKLSDKALFFAHVQAWENAVPGEDRSSFARQIRQCYESNSSQLTLRGGSFSKPPPLPPLVTGLFLFNCIGITEVSVSTQLTHLVVADCVKITAIQLPVSLVHFSINGLPELTELSNPLPASLTYLNINRCGMKLLPSPLPPQLTTLRLTNLKALEGWLDLVPDSIVDMCITNCPGVTALPHPLPSHLKYLNLIGWLKLTELPQPLPVNLEDLNITNCPCITHLPYPLPAGLTCLNVTECTGLTALLTPLPVRLTTIIGAKHLPRYTKEVHELLKLQATVKRHFNLLRVNGDLDDNHASELFIEYFLSERHLWGTAEAKKYPTSFAEKQINLLTQMTNDRTLCKACFDLARKGMADCNDNAEFVFQEMQEKAMECQMMKPGRSEIELIQYADSLRNQEKLTQLIIDTPEIKRAFLAKESIEAHLALCLLCHELNIPLPVPVTAMLYEETGWEQFRDPGSDQKLTASDIKDHVSRLLRNAFFSDDEHVQVESRTQFLAAQPFWQAHVDKNNCAHREKINAINVDAEKKQDEIFNNLIEYKKYPHTAEEFKSQEILSAHEMHEANEQRVNVIYGSYLEETKRLLNQQKG